MDIHTLQIFLVVLSIFGALLVLLVKLVGETAIIGIRIFLLFRNKNRKSRRSKNKKLPK